MPSNTVPATTTEHNLDITRGILTIADTYLAGNTTVIPGAICRMGSPGLYYPNQAYVNCECDWFGDTQQGVIATFQLPPFMIHESCVENPKCVGFRVLNNQTVTKQRVIFL